MTSTMPVDKIPTTLLWTARLYKFREEIKIPSVRKVNPSQITANASNIEINLGLSPNNSSLAPSDFGTSFGLLYF
jgi:hypothetical protein